MIFGEKSVNIGPAFLVCTLMAVSKCVYACPAGCGCVGGQAICPDNSVTSIPEASQLPADTTVMQLSHNQFTSTELQPANFSGYHNLEEVRLKNCGIRSIASDTFRGALGLVLLDLSENQLRTVAQGAFNGLSLEYLFLNNNPHLELSLSFAAGMTAELVDLSHCGLQEISEDMFGSMMGTLRKLVLHNNELVGFSPGMLAVFASVNILKLHNNPIACDCNAKWLKDFYDKNEVKFQESSESIRCNTPRRLHGDAFEDLIPQQFLCDTPSVSNLSLWIEADVTVLRCEALGFPLPDITWHWTGRINRFSPAADRNAMKTVGEIRVPTDHLDSQSSFICVASNPVGNATSILNLTHIITKPGNAPCNNLLTTTGSEVVIPANVDQQPKTEDQSDLLFMKKYFSLVDLLSAILGTFVGTLVISVVILHFCVYRRKRKYTSSSSPMSDYSDSLKNDSSSSSCHPPSNTAHQMMLRDPHSISHCIQNRPLPNKPYAQVYDEAHYMSPPHSERDEFDSNVISPYGHLNTMGTVFCPTMSPCEACRNQTEPHTSS